MTSDADEEGRGAQSATSPLSTRCANASWVRRSRRLQESGYADTQHTCDRRHGPRSRSAISISNFGSKQAILIACVASRAQPNALAAEPTPAPQPRRAGGDVGDVRSDCSSGGLASDRRWRSSASAIAEARPIRPEVAETLNDSRAINRGALAAARSPRHRSSEFLVTAIRSRRRQ